MAWSKDGKVEQVSPFAASMGELARLTGISEAARNCVGGTKGRQYENRSLQGAGRGERSRRADSGCFFYCDGSLWRLLSRKETGPASRFNRIPLGLC